MSLHTWLTWHARLMTAVWTLAGKCGESKAAHGGRAQPGGAGRGEGPRQERDGPRIHRLLQHHPEDEQAAGRAGGRALRCRIPMHSCVHLHRTAAGWVLQMGLLINNSSRAAARQLQCGVQAGERWCLDPSLQVYATSIMFGYFVRRVDKRFQLERSLGLLSEQDTADAVNRLERLFAQVMQHLPTVIGTSPFASER